MPTLYEPRSDSNKRLLTGVKTFGEFLTELGVDGNYDDVVMYNWGTNVPAEVNRALVELVGCSAVDPDPRRSTLDPALGTTKAIHVPVPWSAPTGLPLGTTHVVTAAPRCAAPAVTITKLPQWFAPGPTATPDIQYMLEGDTVRAAKVDFEVHTAHYYAVDAGGNRVASDTLAGAGSTRLFQHQPAAITTARAPATAQTVAAWKGESDATKGVLEKKGTTYVNYGCAPYTTLVRYYKDDNDAKVKLLLGKFYPTWRRPATTGGTRSLDPASMKVTWTITGDDTHKLKAGQLVVWDKTDAVVFFAPLDAAKLAKGEYDLLNDTTKKLATPLSPAGTPYRVQIQAHSDADEPDGLALAAMHTQVRAYNYARVQCVGLEIKPGTKKTTGTTPSTVYLGDAKDEDDIKKRVAIMIDAIRTAAARTEIDASAEVLKLFMAPEFFFRGADGGYDVANLDSIMPELREEVGKFEYADWLFVFGTAVGYLRHEETDALGAPTGRPATYGGDAKHNMTIDAIDTSNVSATKITVTSASPPEAGWRVHQDRPSLPAATDTIASVSSPSAGTYEVTLAGAPALARGAAFFIAPVAVIDAVATVGLKTELTVTSNVCARIPSIPDSAHKWEVRQGTGTVAANVVTCTSLGGDRYRLLLDSNAAFVQGDFTLVEPMMTEVLNVALVQKGWPAALGGAELLREAVVYKEAISAIDFIGDFYGKHADWHARDSRNRKVEIHGTKARTVMPTDGSADLLGASPNTSASTATWIDKQGQEHRVGSEINLSGVGGGSVVVIDDVTFGIEVCLDHGKSRLGQFYNGTAKGARAGDPFPQVQLIPSWGMSIGGGSVVTSHNGIVFNVDGGKPESVLRLNDGTYSCDVHVDVAATAAGTCTENAVLPYCGTCSAPVAGHPPACPKGHAVATYLTCDAPVSYYRCPIAQCMVMQLTAGNCTTHTGTALVEHYRCEDPVIHGYWCVTCAARRPGPGKCPTHTTVDLVAIERCMETVYRCPVGACAVTANAPGNCSAHTTTALVATHWCMNPRTYFVCPACAWFGDVAGNCPVHTATALVPKNWCRSFATRRVCLACGSMSAVAGACTAHALVDAPHCRGPRQGYACPTCGAPGPAGNCTAHPVAIARVLYEVCTACNQYVVIGANCGGCGTRNSLQPCGDVAPAGCATHGNAALAPCGFFDVTGNCPQAHNTKEECGAFAVGATCREGRANPRECQPYLAGYGCSHGHKAPELCGYYPAAGTCGQAPPHPATCKQFYLSTGACTCGKANPKKCGKQLAPSGRSIAAARSAIAVPASNPDTHFENYGLLSIYPVQTLPPAEVV